MTPLILNNWAQQYAGSIPGSSTFFHQLSVTGEEMSKRCGFSLPRKSVVKITDRPNMTYAFYPGRRAANQTSKQMSQVMRKPTFCICENKDTDQLRGNREADQRLCFRYIDSTIPLLSKSEISSL